MDNLPKQISEAFLESIISDYSSSHKYDDLKVDISLLAHAYFGMYRNPRYSADWVAHKYMFIDAANKMSWRLFGVFGRECVFVKPLIEKFDSIGYTNDDVMRAYQLRSSVSCVH